MQPRSLIRKIRAYLPSVPSINPTNRIFFLLCVFLLAVILVAFIIPQLNFGRLYAVDAYTHLYHTNIMVSSKSISDFFEKAGSQVINPSSDDNPYNNPIGLWLFGATISKVTGITPIQAEILFMSLFIFIIVGSFYLYSDLMLASREQKIIACLFLLSMPIAATYILSYQSVIFVLPFLFFVLYFSLKEPIQWKMFPLLWISLFALIISHSGTFVFLICFSIFFFLLYCLVSGRFLPSIYISIVSTWFIYIFIIQWFPDIQYGYEYTSLNLLMPGELVTKMVSLSWPADISHVFYSKLIVEQSLLYAGIFSALLFTIGLFLVYIHKKVAIYLQKRKTHYPAFVLPIQTISHSFMAAPIWLGPVHILFSLFGFFHLDCKGKCILVTALITGLLPDIFRTLQGTSVATGAIRQIIYLVIIIPIVATLGFWHILNYLNDPSSRIKKIASGALWITVCISMIVLPVVGNVYYMPTISGADYIIGGLTWLGDHGDHNEKVAGYSLRPIPIYTNMTDAWYDLPNSIDRSLINSLKSVFFTNDTRSDNVHKLRDFFGVKYLICSDRILDNLGGTRNNLTADSNTALTKIYASKDFGIYEINFPSENGATVSYSIDNITFKKGSGTYEVDSGYYKITIGENNPEFRRFGTHQQNFLGTGYFTEKIAISGTDLNPDEVTFNIEDTQFTSEINNNQIIYRTELTNSRTHNAEGTLEVQYTFYPYVIKRECRLSNDQLVAKYSPKIKVQYSMNIYSPMSQFIIQNDDTQFEKQIIPFQERVTKTIRVENIYLYTSDNGMYISFDSSSPQPSSISYTGSTSYNKSSVEIQQSNSLSPGASFYSTQFLSLGNKYSAEKHIRDIQQIEQIPYSNGEAPILLTGLRTPQSDPLIKERITSGYAALGNQSIPYTEAVNPSLRVDNIANLQNVTLPKVLIDLQELSDNNITIVGSQKMRGVTFDDAQLQKINIGLLAEYMKNQGVTSTGFMPDSFTYNLDTLSILSENNVHFMFSSQDSANTNRNPQIAYLKGEPTRIVLFPVISPSSSSLLSSPNTETIFSDWRAAIDAAADNDGMVLFYFRSQEIGDPSLTDDFERLFSYARKKGLTFSTPDSVAEYFRKLQKIRYSGIIDNDIATIQVTNTNPETVRNVTFKVTLPELEDADYTVTNGTIVKTKDGDGQSVLYICTDIPKDSGQTITVEPAMERKRFHIGIPKEPVIEGPNTITVKDDTDYPLVDADVIVDGSYYQTDKDGKVQVIFKRGYHTIIVQNPGYEKYMTAFTVRGRIFLIEQVIGNVF